MKKKKKKLDYKFRCVNYTDYEVLLNCAVERGLMLHIFRKTKEKLGRTKGISVSGAPDSVEVINVPAEYYNLLRTILSKIIKHIQKEIKTDHIIMLDYSIRSARFKKRDSGDYIFSCEVVGQYADKR